MNENMWQLAQIMMWGFGIQITIMIGFFSFMWNNMNKRFDKMEERLDKMDARLSKLEFDMVEVKTILRMKECCMIQDERQLKKAE